MKDGIYRNTCPRNCFGSCGILSYVENDMLVKVTGDPQHGYTKGKLCAKGYAYTEFVYHPHRLKYPMLQSPRGSGNWKQITWDEAYTIIAEKLIDLNHRYGSNLASGYNKFSGNLGLLHYATEGMFNSFGPHTKPVGNPCALTGKLSFHRSFGESYSSVPEEMAGAKLIVLWGANPAVTNVHQMKFIYEARRNGAKLVVIDPIFTATAQKADIYLQIHPGTDMWLALGIAKLIVQAQKHDQDFLNKNTQGWEAYQHYLQTEVNMTEVCEKTGLPLAAIEELSQLYGQLKPVATWAGLGVQRNSLGPKSIGAINSLVTLTGNLTVPNGGLYYMHFDVEGFPCTLLNHQGPAHPKVAHSREIDIGDFAQSVLQLSDPPLKLLWIASRNIFTQDQNLQAWKQIFHQLELIVTVDLYMTKTAKLSDLVLPAATHFEEEDLNVGYWHYWLSLNQKAIPAYYESKSDLQIARDLTRKLNQLSPGFSNFPAEKEPLDWIKAELTPAVMDRYGITGIDELFTRPFLKQKQAKFSELFQFYPPEDRLKNEQPSSCEQPNTYRLISPQSLLKIHSQYEMLTWLSSPKEEAYIEISTEAAEQNGIQEGAKLEIFNDHGKIVGLAKINPRLPAMIILAHQAGQQPINLLIKNEADYTKETSTYFYDSHVNMRKWVDADV